MRNPLNRMLKERDTSMCELKDHMDPKAGFSGDVGSFFGSWDSTQRMGDRLGLTQDFMPSFNDAPESDDEGISALKNVTTGASGSGNKSAKFQSADRKGVTKKSLVIKKPKAKGYS